MPGSGSGSEFLTSHGTTFRFDGNEYRCMDISYEKSAPSRERVDMTTLDIATGEEAVMMLAPIVPKRDPRKFTIAYRTMSDSAEIEEGVEADLELDDGTGSGGGGSGSGGLVGKYRVTSCGVSRKANAYIEGSATFEEVIDGEDPISGSS